MLNRSTSHFAAFTAFNLLIMLFATPCLAQSDAELRRQNEQLTEQVQELEGELETARERVKELEARLAQLERDLANARRAASSSSPKPLPPLPEEEVTIDESVPQASPRALFNAIKESHDKTMEGMEIGRGGRGTVDDGKRRAYMKRLEGWRAAADREFRGQVAWHVRVVDARFEDVVGRESRDRVVTLVAVDPETDVRLGQAFDVVISKTLADRLERLEARDELDLLVMRGTLIPRIRINPDRTERGSFDNPPFIGPFAEFVWQLEVRGLLPVKEDEAAAAADEAPATNKPAPPTPTQPEGK